MGALSGVRDVLRHDAQAGSLRSNLLSKRRRAEHVKMTYAERVAETNGPIYKTDVSSKGRNGRVPSPPPKSPRRSGQFQAQLLSCALVCVEPP